MQAAEGRAREIHLTAEDLLRRKRRLAAEKLPAALARQRDDNLAARSGQNLQAAVFVDVHDEVLRGLLDDAEFAIGHEVLRELLLLVGHEPGEVGLVFGVDAGHQLDIRAESRA